MKACQNNFSPYRSDICLHKCKVTSRDTIIAYLRNVELLSVNYNLGLSFAALDVGKNEEKDGSAQSRIIDLLQQLVQSAELDLWWSHFHTFKRKDSKY
jgi:hypothetical protein